MDCTYAFPGVMRMKFRLLGLFTSFLLVSATDSFAQKAPAPRPITIDDHFSIRDVEDPQISPDSQWVSYTVKSALLKEDKHRSRIWMLPRPGGDAVALTGEDVSSSHA